MLVANPGADVYGSDLQMLESVSAMVAHGWSVVVALPADGPLVSRIRQRGAQVRISRFPVIRRSHLTLSGFVDLLRASLTSFGSLWQVLGEVRPDVLYVNTVTLPWWLLAGRLAGIPVVCHVHEAEQMDRSLVLRALNAPLVLADHLIFISETARQATLTALPSWGACRQTLIYNGVPQPPDTPRDRIRSATFRMVLVCRLSPRKAPHVAIDALALLKGQGHRVHLEVCGTAFPGYEWYVDQLHARARDAAVEDDVTWSGYVNPVWPVLERSDVALATSVREPFGNAVVEAQLCRRPVVAAAAMGHLETVENDVTGLLYRPGDAGSLARAVMELIEDEERALRLATTGQSVANEKFSTSRYRQQVRDVVSQVCDPRQRLGGPLCRD